MNKAFQIAVRDVTAARLLDLPTPEFLRLVAAGALPPPTKIGGHDRWLVERLQAILTGDAAKPDQDFTL